MPPALILALLVAAMLAMLPVRRLHQAHWTAGALLGAWLVYVAGFLLGLEMGLGSRLLLPVLVVLFVLPFISGQPRLERVGRMLGGRTAPAQPDPGPRVIDVTPPGDRVAAGPPTPEPARRRGRKPPVEYR